VSFIQTAEGYLQETQDVLHRIRELAVQSANGIYTEEDRLYIQIEVSALVAEVDRIASHAQFNGMNMLTGRYGKGDGTQVMLFHIGANMDQNTRVYIGEMTASSLGVKNNQGAQGPIAMVDPDAANKAIGVLDSALKQVNQQRADLGAYQNRFEVAAQGLAVAAENLQASESRIRDVNMASKMVDFTKESILNQAGTAMLAQANVRTQSVLQLLG